MQDRAPAPAARGNARLSSSLRSEARQSSVRSLPLRPSLLKIPATLRPNTSGNRFFKPIIETACEMRVIGVGGLNAALLASASSFAERLGSAEIASAKSGMLADP